VGDDLVYRLSPSDSTLIQQAHLGEGATTAFAASASGLAVVGRLGSIDRLSEEFQNLLVLKPGASESVVWSRGVSTDVAPLWGRPLPATSPCPTAPLPAPPGPPWWSD